MSESGSELPEEGRRRPLYHPKNPVEGRIVAVVGVGHVLALPARARVEEHAEPRLRARRGERLQLAQVTAVHGEDEVELLGREGVLGEVAVLAALQVDLTGQVCSDSIGTRFYSGIGGQVDFMFYHPAAVLPYLKSSKLRALAVSSQRRSTAAPEVPTVAESGYPGFDLTAWYMLAGPAGLDAATRAHLVQAINGVLQEPKVRQQLSALGLEQATLDVAQLPGFVDAEVHKWTTVVKQSNAQID